MKTSLNETRPEPDYLLTSQVMQRLGKSREVIRRLIRIGELRAIKEGQIWMIEEDSVRAYGRRRK